MDTPAAQMVVLTQQVNVLRGDNMEITAPRRIVPTIIQQLRLRRPEIFHSVLTIMPPEVLDQLHDAEEASLIPTNADADILRTDLIIRAEKRSDRQTVWVVTEISATIDEHDITRARNRANYLATATGVPALATVVGQDIDPQDQERAESSGVRVIMI